MNGQPGVEPAAFDPLAPTYDRVFSHSALGRRLRERVWQVADARFAPGDQLIDLGAGTGEDALHLANRGCRVDALEPSAAMREQALGKLAAAGLADRVRWFAGSLGSPASTDAMDALGTDRDGAIANFGVLNCVDDLELAGAQIAACLRPGARLIAAVMAPACLWEIAWFLRRGDPRRAVRRLLPAGSSVDFGAGALRVRYPSPARMRRAFSPHFRLRHVEALGLFLPPSYATAWLEADPRRLPRLSRLEARARSWPWAAAMGDHYLIDFERVGLEGFDQERVDDERFHFERIDSERREAS